VRAAVEFGNPTGLSEPLVERRRKRIRAMSDAHSSQVERPARRSVRWTSFIGSIIRGKTVRSLEEEGNPLHRVRVEHNRDTLLVHISGEHGHGWTTVAIDRASREWSIAQRRRQMDATRAAMNMLYRSPD
jgi:hypothetical protein